MVYIILLGGILLAIDKSLVSGSTSMLLLNLLQEQEMYGYEMIEALEEKSQNVFSFKAGTLYPLLHTLESQGLVVSEEKPAVGERVRKYYRITPKGRKTLADKKSEWSTFTAAVNRMIEGNAMRGGASCAEACGA